MKTLLFITVILLLYSCSTVHKASEDQYAVSKSQTITTGNNSEMQRQDVAQVKHSEMSAISSTGNGFERWIEEQVMEYSIPGKDSSAPGAITSKLVQTKRTIKERGNQQVITVEQSASQDSLRKQAATATVQELQSEHLGDLTMVQKRKLTKRTGIPWYIWAGGGAGITLGFWLKKRYLLHRVQPFKMDER